MGNDAADASSITAVTGPAHRLLEKIGFIDRIFFARPQTFLPFAVASRPRVALPVEHGDAVILPAVLEQVRQLLRAETDAVHFHAGRVSRDDEIVRPTGAPVFQKAAIRPHGFGLVIGPLLNPGPDEGVTAFPFGDLPGGHAVGNVLLNAGRQSTGEIPLALTIVAGPAIHFQSGHARGKQAQD